jgi:hypothetical protein
MFGFLRQTAFKNAAFSAAFCFSACCCEKQRSGLDSGGKAGPRDQAVTVPGTSKHGN